MTWPTAEPVEWFFREIDGLERWPEGVVSVPARIDPPAFFSASDGLWRTADQPPPPFPFGGVMLVGHNLDSEGSYRRRLAERRPHGGEAGRMPTWRNLLPTLERAGVDPTECFFTNAYVGLRAGDRPTGGFAGEKDPAFRSWCEQFLVHQVQVMRPRAVAVLGRPARQFVAGLSDDLSAWKLPRQADVDDAGAAVVHGARLGEVEVNAVCLVHPSFWPRHVGARRHRGITGPDAETAMLTEAATG